MTSIKVMRKDYASHWDQAFRQTPEDKLGWYEKDFSASLRLIEQSGITKDARILMAGAGTSMLVDRLLDLGYQNLIITDISKTALNKIGERVGNRVELVADDLTNPTMLGDIQPVDLWFDRAVLHFFVDEKDRQQYFALLNRLTFSGSKVILAEFSLNGATVCSGLAVRGYSQNMLQIALGREFEFLSGFDHTYTMPSGDLRPYVYALFERVC